MKQEDTAKYRCKVPPPPTPPGTSTAPGPPDVCTKLFKAPDFWRKHVEKRHPEFYTKIATEVDLVNAYVLDPAHIAPSRSDPNSNGHFPTGPGGQPVGTPRGFSLGNFSQGQMGVGQMGMMPGMVGMPGMMGGVPLPMQMGMPGGGVGPMRHTPGGRMMNGGGSRMPGPYARNDGRGGRGPMGLPGRPPMAMGGMEGGAGPQEAVMGRSLRSYEDLDAAGGDGVKGEELDY